MNNEQIKKFLQQHHLSPNFTYGQNFLIDDIVLEDMVDAAEVSKQDAVLEIGPGIGNLTRRLCERAGFVLSVEKDPKFLPILKSIKKDYKNFWFEIGDVLDVDFLKILDERRQYANVHAHDANGRTNNSQHSRGDEFATFASPYKVVANIPYYITGKILQMLMTHKHKPATITMLMQKEVAEQVVAEPGDLSILAISVQLYGDARIVQMVPARSFYPAPKVDSAVLQIEVHTKPKFKIADEKKFFGLLKACFAGKRKQLHNTLVNNVRLEKTKALEILKKLKINPAARPQELSIEQWVELSKFIE